VLREIDFRLKKFADAFKPFTFVETNYIKSLIIKIKHSSRGHISAQKLKLTLFMIYRDTTFY